jgi:Secretion system C-terminal sorting domain/FG-GAP-like repeat
MQTTTFHASLAASYRNVFCFSTLALLFLITCSTNSMAQDWIDHQILPPHLGTSDIDLFDMDLDGDLDILMAEDEIRRLSWIENVATGPWPRHLIPIQTDHEFDRVAAGDMDNDGDIDLVINDGVRHLIIFLSSDGSWTEFEIPIAVGNESFNIADMDGDGDNDIVTMGSGSYNPCILENQNLNFTRNEISDQEDDHSQSMLCDIDNDGDIDLLTWYNIRVRLYTNHGDAWTREGLPLTFAPHTQSNAAPLFIDGIDDPLVVVTNEDANAVAIYRKQGDEWQEQILTNNLESALGLAVGDINQDGLDDIVAAGRDAVMVWEQNDGHWDVSTHSPALVVLADQLELIVREGETEPQVFAAFPDGGDHNMALLDRTQGHQLRPFWLTARISGALSLDYDGDGRGDFISGGRYLDTRISVAWHNTTEGFFQTQGPPVNLDLLFLSASDIDDDGAAEFVSLHAESGETVVWGFEDDEWQYELLATNIDVVSRWIPLDFDGDGDKDIVLLGHTDGNEFLRWFEQTESSWMVHEILDNWDCESGIAAAQLDEDPAEELITTGNDVVTVFNYDGIFWTSEIVLNDFEITGPLLAHVDLPEVGLEFIQATMDEDGVSVIRRDAQNVWTEEWVDLGGRINAIGDIDGDGAVDLLGSIRYEGMVWWSYVDGEWSASEPYAQVERGCNPIDLDEDGDLDVLVGGSTWLEKTGTASVSDQPSSAAQPDDFMMSAAWPNPFNPSTTISVSLSQPSELNVSVFNINGQQVATLASGIYDAGSHTLTFDASNLASGLYIVRAFVPNRMNQVQKVMLLQ